jgi:hypothetical protein
MSDSIIIEQTVNNTVEISTDAALQSVEIVTSSDSIIIEQTTNNAVDVVSDTALRTLEVLAQGPRGATGATGAKGDTGDTGPAGQGIALGGSTGQMLVKASATDYETSWATPFNAASPSAIGSTTPAAGTFTTLGVTTSVDAIGAAAAVNLNLNAKGGASTRVGYTSSGAHGLVLNQDPVSTGFSGRLFFESSGGVASIRNSGGNVLNFATAAVIGSTSGTDQMRVAHTAAAVNYVQVTGAATTGAPTISAQGSDTNITLAIASKGGSGVTFENSASSTAFGFELCQNTTVDKSVFIDFHTSTGTDYNFRILRSSGVNGNVEFANSGTGYVLFNSTTPIGTSAADTKQISRQTFTAGNGISWKNYAYRHTAGSDWTGVGLRTGMLVDSTDMSYIEFNPVGAAQGLAVQVASSQPFQIKTTGGEQLRVSNTASAVNYVQVTGAATGGGVQLTAQGSDTNVNMFVKPKGTGAVIFNTGGGYQLTVINTPSAVNWAEIKGGAAGSGPQLSAVGSDTNIDLTLTPKGTGNVRFGTLTASADAAITGYITIKDSGGTVRKLAVIA